MQLFVTISVFFLAAAVLIWLFAKYKYELHVFQQNSYRNERYFKWLRNNIGDKQRVGEFVPMFLTVLGLFMPNAVVLSVLFIVAGAVYLFLSFKAFTRKAKVRFNFTARAKRLYFTSIGLCLIFVAIYCIVLGNRDLLLRAIMGLASTAILSFLILPLSNIILKPVEKRISNWYINDAKRILAEHKDMIIVGITGSYGKTSTKHFLNTILSQKYNVLMTPGSYNTTMGVVRTIREYMQPTHQLFICEMGAKQINDIKEICDIVHPKYGILTSVAEQHLDTFHNIENVRKTKFELIDSLPDDGVAFLNADYEIICGTSHNKLAYYYSVSNPLADYSVNMETIKYSQQGAEFEVLHKGEKIATFSTPLLGEYNISNIVACVACAYKLGLTTEQIAYGIHKLEAVEHRMQMSTNAAGLIIIDDAFNSNPKGAKMALEVLSGFPNQKFVITPGIIELADKQDYYNRELGKQIAHSVDYAILVGKEQTKAIYQGLKDENFPEDRIYIASGLNDGANYAFSIARRGDAVLFENDLPDFH